MENKDLLEFAPDAKKRKFGGLAPDEPRTADVIVEYHGTERHLHRAVLALRFEYFYTRMFDWGLRAEGGAADFVSADKQALPRVSLDFLQISKEAIDLLLNLCYGVFGQQLPECEVVDFFVQLWGATDLLRADERFKDDVFDLLVKAIKTRPFLQRYVLLRLASSSAPPFPNLTEFAKRYIRFIVPYVRGSTSRYVLLDSSDSADVTILVAFFELLYVSEESCKFPSWPKRNWSTGTEDQVNARFLPTIAKLYAQYRCPICADQLKEYVPSTAFGKSGSNGKNGAVAVYRTRRGLHQIWTHCDKALKNLQLHVKLPIGDAEVKLDISIKAYDEVRENWRFERFGDLIQPADFEAFWCPTKATLRVSGSTSVGQLGVNVVLNFSHFSCKILLPGTSSAVSVKQSLDILPGKPIVLCPELFFVLAN